MALYRLEVEAIKRSDGRSVIAAAAYRSASRIHDQRLEMIFDYEAKRGVERVGVMAPEDAPARFADRSVLWNEAELADTRKDSRPAREILLALPHELDVDQREALVRDFIAAHVVSKGMIADYALHFPDRHGDERNHHAHILVTTREVGPDGFGKKVDGWNQPQLIRDWREGWELEQNAALRRHLGPEAPQVTSKSLADQGIERPPTVHLGPAASAMERRGERSSLGDYNRAVIDVARELRDLNRGVERTEDEIVERAPKAVLSLTTAINELGELHRDYVREHASLRAEREGMKPPEVLRAAAVKAEVLEPARRAQREARARWRQVQARAARLRSKEMSLARWFTNPARMIWAKHAELNALSKARTELRAADLEVRSRRAWLNSPEGQDYVGQRIGPSMIAAKEARSKARTLERRMRRVVRRAYEVEAARLKAMVARELGHPSVQAPTRTTGPTQLVRALDQASLALVRQHEPARQREAYQRVRSGPEPGRTIDLPPIR